MKKLLHKFKFLAVLVVLSLFTAGTAFGQATRTWLPTNGGVWTTGANWSGGVAPVAGDNVIINSDQSLDITGHPAISLLSLSISGNCTLESSAGFGGTNLITVTGTFSVAAGKTFNIGISGTGRTDFTLGAAATGTIDGTFHLFSTTLADRIITINGNLTISSTGVITGQNNAQFTLSSGATLQIANTAGITTTGATGAVQVPDTRTYAAGANFIYNGTSAQVTGNGLTQNSTANLTIDNSAGVTLSAATTITGNLLISSGTLSTSGSNFAMGIGGNFINDGGFTPGTSTITFSGAAKTISGTSATSIANAAITGTIANTNTLTVTTALSGTGTLTNNSTLNIQGTCSTTTLANTGTATVTGTGNLTTALANFTNTGTLNLQGSGTIAGITNNAGGTVNLTNSGTITSFNNATSTSVLDITDLTVATITTLTATALGNTVIYGGGGAQTLKVTTYDNLTLSGSGAKTTTTGVTVNGVLDMAGSATVTTALTYAANSTLQYDKTGTAGSEWPGTFSGSGGVVINTGTVTFSGQKIIANNLSIKTGAVLNLGTNTTSTAHGILLGGIGQTTIGSYGGTGSSATVINTTFFAAVAGRITIPVGTTKTSAASGNWSDSATWTGGVIPGAQDNAVIASGMTVTVDIQDAVCATLAINNTATATAILTFTTSGSPKLIVGGLTTVGNSGNANREGTITFTNGSTLITGTLSLGAIAAQTSAITMTAGGLLKVNGAITVFSGTTWTRGTGTVELGATNTLPATIFTSFNNLIISGGTTTTGVALPTISGDLTVKAGAAFSLAHAVGATSGPTGLALECGTTGSTISGAGLLTLGGDVTVTKVLGTGVGATVSCPVALGATRTFTVDDETTSANDLTMGGIISGSTFGIVKDGTGTMVLSGTNTYSGGTNLTAGKIKINNTAALGAAANAFTISSGAQADIISNVTVGTLSLGGLGTGNGTWGFTGSAATFINSTYFVTSTSGRITVSTDTRATPTVTPTVGSYTYTGLSQGPNTATNTGTGSSYTFSYVGVSGTTYGPSATLPTNAGNYTVTATVTASTDGFYKSNNSGAVAFSIAVRPLTVTANTATHAYGVVLTPGAGATPLSVTGMQNSETLTGTVTLAYTSGNTTGSAVGSYSGAVSPSLFVKTGGTATLSNYSITYVTNNLSVTAATLTVTANTATHVYGATLTPGAGATPLSVTGMQNSETLTGTVTLAYTSGNTTSSAVGSYSGAVSPSLFVKTGGTATLSNYSIIYVTNNLSVTVATLTVTANTATHVYGATLTPGVGASPLSVTGMQNSETLTGTVTLAYNSGNTTSSAVGNYIGAVSPSLFVKTGGTATLSNYSITYVTNNLNVTAAALTVTANPQSKCIGTLLVLGTTAFTYGTTQNSETITSVTLTSTGGLDGIGGANGTYVGNIVPSSPTGGGGFVASNYNITFVNGTLTINVTNTAGVASSLPTLCVNTVLTAITHTTTGATEIGTATGLPSGVTAGWASNTITISGTPTASGTFNYTVPLTGGCGTFNATGTIIVNGASTAAVISGTASICSGSNGNLQVAITGGLSPYTVVYSAGSVGSYTSGSNIAVTPASTTAYTLTSVTDANGCAGSGNSGSAVLTIDSTTSVNGGPWSNGVPAAGKSVIFDGTTITLGSTLTACSLTLKNNSVVTIQSGSSVILTGALDVDLSSTFTLDNNANLIQGNSNYTNTGNIIVKRNSSALKRFDYTLWSSPVTGQGVYAFSPFTFANRFYVYNTSTNLFNNPSVGLNVTGLNPDGVNGTDSNNVQFASAKGYLIRIPWDHPTAATIWNGTFTGVPRNGNINYTMTNGGSGLRFNLVGNPYPSPINMTTFVSDNSSNITGTLYFWRDSNNSTVDNAYCTWAGGTFTSNNQAQAFNPSGVIRTGQGFIVEASGASTTLSFKNGQRTAENANQFFRTNTLSTDSVETNRIWLNLSNTAEAFCQMAVGYMTDATDAVDMYDGKNINTGNVLLSSILDNTDYTIQGKSLPFNAADVVPLSCKITDAGNYTIALDHVDGIFTGGAQSVYLKDNLTTTIHDLNSGAYTFTSAAGTFTNRFEIVYQNQLGVDNPAFTANNVIVYSQNNGFVVNSGSIIMSSIKVFDIRGRLIEERKAVNASQTTINGGLANEVLLVQITSEDGIVVTKKVIR